MRTTTMVQRYHAYGTYAGDDGMFVDYNDHLAALAAKDEEIGRAEQRYHLLASEMVYEGNSVQHWRNKGTAYKSAIGAVWDALRESGIHPDGNTSAADAVRKALAAKDAEIGRLKADIDRFNSSSPGGWYRAWETADEDRERMKTELSSLGALFHNALARAECAEAEAAQYKAELQNIANAQPATQGDDWRDQFQEWAQSHARHALAARAGGEQ